MELLPGSNFQKHKYAKAVSDIPNSKVDPIGQHVWHEFYAFTHLPLEHSHFKTETWNPPALTFFSRDLLGLVDMKNRRFRESHGCH